MQKYKLWNNIFGWLTFIFAAVVYTMTMESSGSFWDCGEFVSGCFKLQVVHPPGAPWFLMLGKIFSLFTGANPLVAGSAGSNHVAQSVNFMSALMTAGAVLFTFWTTTALARKFVFRDGQYTTGRIITVIGAGLIAGSCCTFLDSQWFSAVEGEVYATSQFFQSFIFWAIMKWDADEGPYADHWLVLIAYMTGVSIGVHLLSLLALPAIAIVFYYKKFKNPTVLGWIAAAAIGFLVLGMYMKYIISFTLSYLASMDLLFVNSLGLGFNSGVLFGILLIIIVLASLLRYTQTGSEQDYKIAMGIAITYVLIGVVLAFNGDSVMATFIRVLYPVGLWASKKYGYETRRYFNLIVLSVAFSYIGYSSYLMVPIRAIANPPINMNRPSDPFSLKGYVDRDQYGERPLLLGPDYTEGDEIVGYNYYGTKWLRSVDPANKKYVNDGQKQDYKYRDGAPMMLFPRMGFLQDEQKKRAYEAWINPDLGIVNQDTHEVVERFPRSNEKQAQARLASYNKQGGDFELKDIVSFGDNISYFLKYQIGYMYFRYFMWNFAGKQDDIQGTYANDHGRWICGIPFIDNSKLFFTPDWPQQNLSQTMLHNKARNKFYMIPFIIGLIGLIFTFFKDEKTFWTILVLFGTTGILQIIYQNEPPIEPRDRDYATACSFLVYTIWIGFGVVGIIDTLVKRFKLPEIPISVAIVAMCASAPFLMGSQGWDDHTRHNRYIARDSAIDYLQSCAPNAILFTQGDNDTYPLWYAQEVEGVRQDIRIINLSLLGVDWYIHQLYYKVNDAAPLKLSFKQSQYEGSKREYIPYHQAPGVSDSRPSNLQKVMQFVASDNDAEMVMTQDNKKINYLPARNFYLNVDTNKVKEMNMVSPEDYDKIVPRMEWGLNTRGLQRGELMTLDIVANNLMDHPIYFAVSVSSDAYVGLDKYFQLEGLTYRVVPKVNTSGSPYSAPVRVDEMYDNMMHKFKFAGIKENQNIYLDETSMRMTVNIRGNFGRLGEALLAEGKKDSAAAVIDYIQQEMPADRVPHNYFDCTYPDIYLAAGQKEKGKKLLLEMFNKSKNELDYYKTVFQYTLEQAKKSDEPYYEQLMGGIFMKRQEVQEELVIMQQLTRTASNPAYDLGDLATSVPKEFEQYVGYFEPAAAMQQQQRQQTPGAKGPGM